MISKFQMSRGYLREEVGTKAYKALHNYIVGRIAKSRMKWAGHIVRMKDERLPKYVRQRNNKVTEHEEDQKWDDCPNRDIRNTALGWRKVNRKGQPQGAMETNNKSSLTAEWQLTYS